MLLFVFLPSAVLAGIEFAIVGLGVVALYALPGLLLFWRAGERQLWMLAVGAAISIAGLLFFVATVGWIAEGVAGLLPLGAGIGLVLVWRRMRPPTMRRFSLSPDWSLAVLLLLQIGAVLPVYMAVGRLEENDTLFHAFFNADFFKHLSHTQAIANQGLPGADLFSAGGTLRYYWLQYLLPATALRVVPSADPVGALLAMQHYQNLLLTTLLYALCRSFSVGPRVAAMAVALGLVTLSLDGLGVALSSLGDAWWDVARGINVESWDLGLNLGLDRAAAMSSLFRLYLYVPQHQLALACFVAWLVLLRTMPEFWLRAVLLLPLPGISWMTGGGALLVAACLEVSWAWSRRRFDALLPLFASALGGVLFVFLSGQFNNTALGDPFIHRDFGDLLASTTERLLLAVWSVFSSFGLLALLGFIGVVQKLADTREDWPPRSLPSQLFVFVLLLWLAVSVTVDSPGLLIEAQLKTSFLFIPVLVLGTGLLLLRWPFKEWLPGLRASLTVVLLLGLPSMAHDIIWHLSPLERWIVRVPVVDRTAMHWIRQHTPAGALFQQYPEHPFLLDGRDVWLPVFAGRAVAYAPRSAHVQESGRAAMDLFSVQTSVAERQKLAVQLNLEYLYLSASLQPNEYRELAAEFARAGWRPIYDQHSVSVWALR